MFLSLPLLCAYSVFLLSFWRARDDLHLSLPWDVAMIGGFGAFFFLLTLFTFTGRPLPFPFFDGKFFLSLHRWLTALFLGFLAFHIGAIVVTDPQILYDFWPSGTPGMQFGALAAFLAMLTPGLAFRRVWRRLFATAGIFRISHVILASAVLGGSVFHIVTTRVHVVLSWQVWACVSVAAVALVLPATERWLLARVTVRPGWRRRIHTRHLAGMLAGVIFCAATIETAAFLLWRR